jgi:hypothetical protein
VGGDGKNWLGLGTYYAGGGGGGGDNGPASNANGGLGGPTKGTAASDNSGSGGCGGNSPNAESGYAGGSGIVIMRFLSTFGTAASTTGSVTFSTDGTYNTYTFVGGGTITF